MDKDNTDEPFIDRNKVADKSHDGEWAQISDSDSSEEETKESHEDKKRPTSTRAKVVVVLR